MSYQFIISEKPQASLKIAQALADKKVEKKVNNKVSYYEITHNGKKIVIGCAVGHLYGLAEKDKKGWTYPVFNFYWQPTYLIDKSAKFTKAYLDTLTKLCKDADDIYNFCDVDTEGELIFWNILRFVCNRKDAKRAYFSTLTKDELIKAFEEAKPHINFGLASAGETRHSLDWLWGINLSRALTLSIKSATGMFKLLSSGRVQGPALKTLYDREIDIKNFKSDPYWEIELKGLANKEDISAWHKQDKFWKKEEADIIIKKTKGKKAIVKSVEKKETKQPPLTPFDLTTLQMEAYRTLNISPKNTLEIAQNLYTGGFISYPRTSSQKLPESIGYVKILKSLSKKFLEAGELLKKKNLVPSEGKKTDPAHPAIYPTGDIPKLEGKDAGLYELIVRRFFVCFGEDALRETMTVEIDVNDEIFVAKGTRTKVEGWHKLYGDFLDLKEEELPDVKEKDEIKVKDIILYDKETQPPKRYTEASIIKELERKSLGTKSTRASIIDNLYQRNYIKDKSIAVTDLGMKTTETLQKYCPDILDENLTRKFEEEMEEIIEEKKKPEEILDEAKTVLTKLLAHFKKHEKEIGKELGEATIETRDKESEVGKCPNCKEGILRIMYSKKNKSKFIACDKYPECNTTFSLPGNALIKNTTLKCEKCGFPMVMVIRKGKRPQNVCINDKCPSKQLTEEEEKLAKEERVCSKCGEGKMVLRKSVYGSFLACNRFPKCRNIMKINGNKKDMNLMNVKNSNTLEG